MCRSFTIPSKRSLAVACPAQRFHPWMQNSRTPIPYSGPYKWVSRQILRTINTTRLVVLSTRALTFKTRLGGTGQLSILHVCTA